MAIGGSGGKGGNKSAIKAGEAFVELSADDTKLQDALKRIANKVHSTGLKLAKFGAITGAAGAALLGPLIGLFAQAVKYGDSIQDAADRAGASAEGISRLGYAADLSAASLEDVEGANQKLTKAAVAAARGSKEQAKAFQAMGISADDFLQMDIDERFLTIAETLDTLETPLEKNAFLFDVFGKSAGQLKPLFMNGAEGLRALLKESDRVGQTISNDDAAKSARMMDVYDKSIKAVKYTLMSVGMALFGFTDGAENLSEVFIGTLKGIRDFITENRKIIMIVASVGAGIIAFGSALTVAGLALSGIVAGFSALITVGSAILPFLPIIIGLFAGLAGTAAAIYNLHTILKLIGIDVVALTAGFRGDFVDSIMSIGETFSQTFGGILAALSKGDLALAGEIAMVGLTLAFEKGILFLTKQWVNFKGIFVDIWHDMVFIVKSLWNDLITWILKKLVNMGADILIGIKKLDVFDALPIDAAQIEADRKRTLDMLDKQNVGKGSELNKEYDARKKANDEFRKGQLKDQESVVEKLQQYLDDLIGKANKKDEKPWESPSGKFQEALDKMADGVKGAFQSSDFRGLLAQGPANKIAKDQLEVGKKQLGELQKLNNKDFGPGVFE